jgi:SMC interacting uncharacterized protein involved in chromosome segregation
MEQNMSYEERMKEREMIISEIDGVKAEVENWDRKMDEINIEIEGLKQKIKNLHKEQEKHKKEKSKLLKKINDLEAILIKNGIPVPENGGFEISNGLLGMKRDINMKLTDYMTEEQIRQVFILFFFFLFFVCYFI